MPIAGTSIPASNGDKLGEPGSPLISNFKDAKDCANQPNKEKRRSWVSNKAGRSMAQTLSRGFTVR
jgi:hypothetical protein